MHDQTCMGNKAKLKGFWWQKNAIELCLRYYYVTGKKIKNIVYTICNKQRKKNGHREKSIFVPVKGFELGTVSAHES